MCFDLSHPSGMMETGDPLAGTERSEASAKNIGMVGVEAEKTILICQEFL